MYPRQKLQGIMQCYANLNSLLLDLQPVHPVHLSIAHKIISLILLTGSPDSFIQRFVIPGSRFTSGNTERHLSHELPLEGDLPLVLYGGVDQGIVMLQSDSSVSSLYLGQQG